MSQSYLEGRHTAGRAQGAVLMLGSSLTIMGSVMVAPVLPKITAEFGPVEPQTGVLIPLAITGPALAIALCAPLAGWLADRLGRKRLLILATLVYALCGAAPAFLGSLKGIVGLRLLFGCAEAAVMTCCVTLIADYWHGEQRMRYVNGQVITIGLVGSIFFAIGGALGEHSWRTPFLLYLLPLLLVPAMLKLLWEPEVHHARAMHSTEPGQSSLPPLIINYLLVFFGMVLSFIVPVQSPTLLVGLGVTSSTLIGLCAGLGLLTSLGGSLLWPFVRRSVGLAGCNVLLLLLMASGLGLLITAHTYYQVLLAVTIHGLGAGMLVPNSMAPVMNALSATARGRGLGIFTACLYLGQFSSPLIVIALLGQTGDLHHAIGLLAVASAITALVWALLSFLRRGITSPARSTHP
ncbi:MFS transporter [Pseudomonas luteola]|uniref:MFS transporter n=1 Tax=Pseudomonas luteola TaxID=47886 RepID=UPI0016398A47|nr:MFS transporter [Pseudomonas luteola]